MNEVFAMLWVAMCLFVLYETTAVYEYLKLFRIPSCISKIRDYEIDRAAELIPETMSYGDFVRTFKSSFLIRWLTCPYCFGLALSVGSSFLFSNWQSIPITFMGGLLGYRIFTKADKWLYGGFHA